MEITEKSLASMAGWPVMKEARGLHGAGAVLEASYHPPVLRGKVLSGGKTFATGLRLKNAIDVENLCPCRDSRVRGIICAHAVAVGLEVLSPSAGRSPKSVPEARRPTSAPAATDVSPEVRLSVEGSLRHLEAEISFFYPEPGVANARAEAEALGELVRCGFESEGEKAVLRGEDAIVKFFAADLPQLRGRWNVTEGERFRHVTRDIVPIEPHFAVRDRTSGWLDFHVHFTAGRDAVLSIADVQRLLRSGRPTMKLSDGRIAVADPALVSDLEEVLRDCDPEQERGGYKVRDIHRGYLEASVASWGGSTPAAAKAPGTVALGLLEKILRPYQRDGAKWLAGRAHAGTGGLLADDMGLGKTVQAVAMMEVTPGPHLVVCPSSLVWNWAKEARYFAPHLKILTIEGTGREALFPKIPEHDLVITSYALLRRDVETYRGHDFGTVTLDEAQHIKNPDSHNAKAALALRARARFILTGTPLENSVRDLWSLFDFLLPGHLGTRRDFQDRYEKPILAGERGATWSRLVRRVQPWMLRRRKSEVLDDLPEKLEQIVEVELTPAQKAAYTELQIAARAGIDDLRDRGGAARMRVLTALLRLRQAACDLRLLGKETPAPSAKLDALLELIGEAADGGHKVLVFSQFTSMLDCIAPALDEAGHTWVRLDGSTKDRQAAVERFQTDPAMRVFLISLKAGGAGLNLTAADTVIHFDPWWNPAAEAQATDRAHRIGQKNVVTSIKLIARDTVEERVLELQRRKRELITGLLDDEAVLEGLTNDDLASLVG